MKTIYKIMIATLAATGMCSPLSQAKNWTLKPHAEISLGKPADFKSTTVDVTKVESNEFGVDLGYTFFNKAKNRREVNVGVAYRYLKSDMAIGPMSYSYEASAEADVDKNSYIRFCDVTGFEQSLSLDYVTIPIYLQYSYGVTDWFRVHALAGVKLGFNVGTMIKGSEGNVTSYGIYPQYGDLKIDENYLNDFGKVDFNSQMCNKAKSNGLQAWGLVGAGFDFRIYGPLWIDLGVRYNIGFTDVFKKGQNLSGNIFTEETAPVTYTVAQGTKVSALSDYVTKGALNPLTLNIGLSVNF